jgi:hypothetical protein
MMLPFFTLLLLSSSVALADNAGFVSVPDMGQLMEYPFESDPEWPLELIKVEQEDYKRNNKAIFCLRPPEMIDTIVIHHSETPPTTTPQEINDFHLARGTPEDPWYMIAYSYVINSPYPRTSIPTSKVTVGRPLDLVGAHAGSNAFVSMDPDQKKMWEDKKVLCGKENEDPKLDPTLVQDGLIKANVTTIGVVINGNYAPFSQDNPGGYSKRKPRYPSQGTQDMVARLSCQLQKKYPRIKSIKWHNYYHSTSCPGTIKSYIGQIKTIAKGYGCEFN